MNKKTHEQWVSDNDKALLTLLSSFPKSSKQMVDFVHNAVALIPISSSHGHQAVLEFKAIDSELDEKICKPLDEKQIEWLEGYFNRNEKSLRQACVDLIDWYSQQ